MLLTWATASYANYSRTSYGGQGGDEGGGFLGGSQGGGSQGGGGGGGGGGFSDESLRPVTIKQLLDIEEAYPGAEFALDGAPIKQVTLVGQVRSVNPQQTNVTYRLDDGTGVIEVKKWIDADKQAAAAEMDGDDASGAFALDQHVRIWGRLKSFNNKRHVGAHFIRAVDDYNEVSYHLLEAAYVHLFLTRGPPNQGGGAGGGGGDGGGDGMFVDQHGAGAGNTNGGNSMAPKVAACTPNAQRMFTYINNTPGGGEGLNLQVIVNGTGMSVREVLAAGDELLSQGVVYTTVDDETWALLEY